MNTVEYIINKLEEIGVNDFFGVPGDYNFNIIEAIENHSNTKWIGCTNELNAGYAADGYARVKGYGAFVTTYGVGELSALNAMAGSAAENIPVVHIVGLPSTKNMEEKHLLHHNFQQIDYKKFLRIYENITGASAILMRDNAKIEIDRAFKTLINEKKPVYLAIPADVVNMEISDRYVSYESTSDKDNLSEAAQRIATRINESKNPVVLGDILIKRFDAKIEYREFVSKLEAPTTNFLMGTNIIDMDLKNYVGGYYADFKNPIAQNSLEKTDCLIAVGAIYSDINSYGFNLPYKINDHIAIYGDYVYVMGRRYDNVRMPELLEEITKLVDKRTEKINKPNIGYKAIDITDEPLNSEYIYTRLQEFIKENDIVIAETGCVPIGIAQMKFPSSVEVESQILWGSIGWATPAAMGACAAKPSARVILVTGEGAHQMTAMEIGNIIRQGLKPIFIVINNEGYTIERALSKDPDLKYNDIVQLNYSKFARTFEGDIWAAKVYTMDDFDKALKITQIMNKMCYIEICVDKTDMPKLIAETSKKFKEKLQCKPAVSKKGSSDKQEQLKENQNISTFSGCFNYETTVHQKFKEEEA